MDKLYKRGLQISQNVIFDKMLRRAPRFLGKPVSMGYMLYNAFHKLTENRGNSSRWAHVTELMTAFIRMVRAYTSGQYKGIPTRSLLVGIAVLLYLLSPLDLIPDFLVGIGLLDDLGVMSWFIIQFKDELDKFISWEQEQQGRLPSPAPGPR